MNTSPSFHNKAIDDFVHAEWKKVLGYLGKTFRLSYDDCQDVFQDAFIVLCYNLREGKYDGTCSSLSTYFIGICRNKALELLRTKSQLSSLADVSSLPPLTDEVYKSDKVSTLLALDDADFEEEKHQLVCDIVSNLPSPCNHLLWGFFRDNLSLKSLAQMYGYSEGSVKVVKHRCSEKFRSRYQRLVRGLFD